MMNNGWIERLVRIEKALIGAIVICGIWAFVNPGVTSRTIFRVSLASLPISMALAAGIVGIRSIPSDANNARRIIGVLFFLGFPIVVIAILVFMLVNS